MATVCKSLLWLIVFGVPGLIILCDTLYCVAHGWQPKGVVNKVMIAVACTQVFAGILVLVLPPLRSKCSRCFGKSASVVLSTALSIVLIEALLSRGAWHDPERHSWEPYFTADFMPSPEVIPGVSERSRFTVNSMGVRGPEFSGDDDYRILCIGGSTTECMYLDDEEAWPHIVMTSLNDAWPRKKVWVGNVGRSGRRAENHLSYLKDAPIVSDVDAVVVLVGINDWRTVIRGVRKDYGQDAIGPTPFWRSSALMQLLRRVALTSTGHAFVQDKEGKVYQRLRAERQSGELTSDMPDTAHALTIYASEIRQIIETCGSRGVHPVFLTQPTIWSENMSESARSLLWGSRTADGRYLEVQQLLQGIRQFNAVLKDVCSQEGVPCLDLASALTGREEFYYDDCHFNEAGAREMAKHIAQWFIDRH